MAFLYHRFLFIDYPHSHCVKVSKYGVISGLLFPVFELNTGEYGPEITPHLDNFHAMLSKDTIN